MQKLIMIKYGELTTKKGNRNHFINILNQNIINKLEGFDYTIKKDRVRMYIESNELDKIENVLKNIFGIHGITIAYKLDSKDLDVIKNEALNLLKDKNFKTFKVDTNRADKNYPINSMEISRQVGGFLAAKLDFKKVDVHNPDLMLYIDLRNEGCFIYTDEIPGIGGYPVGIQGKGLLMLSGGIDSPVSGYLAMKRGISIECIYFESPPHTSLEAKNKVISLARKLCKYTDKIKIHVVPFTSIQEAIYKNNASSYMITIMRRMMYRISAEVAKKHKCKVLINGESIGQVASQTLDSMKVINDVTNMPVIRPVACLDKLEIIDIAKKIDTYETSILPFEDCCTIFLPKHPVINPNLESCLEIEERFDYNKLIEETINNIETIEVTLNDNNDALKLL